MRLQRGRSGRGERGFTLVELLITMALISVGTMAITQMFLKSYQLWKRSFDELNLQRNTRMAMATMTKALREATQSSVAISTPAGTPMYSRVDFSDSRSRGWAFYQAGTNVVGLVPLSWSSSGASATTTLESSVDSLSFTYPSFQDLSLIDVGITARKVPYGNAVPIVIQLTERVFLRNP